MKKQIVIIHGGDVHNSQAEYLRDLKRMKVDKDMLMSVPVMKGWKDKLHEVLGEEYEVFTPEMPNWMNSKYAEWKLWFEKLFPFLGKGPVFIGHSLGGIFLARYFAENPDSHAMTGLYLVAAPYRDRTSKDKLADFVLPKNISKLAALGDRVHIYHSSDDDTVAFSNMKKYTKLLPAAKVTTFSDRGHFRVAEFPEIVQDIQDAFSLQKE